MSYKAQQFLSKYGRDNELRTTPSRNQSCPCGSGKKFKNCCAGEFTPPALIKIDSATSVTTPQAIQVALQHQQAGRPRIAEAIYQQVLNVEPNHTDALHLLGLVSHQLDKHDLAYLLIRKAISKDPTAANFHNNLGEVCRALKRFDEALTYYQKALSMQPWFPEAYRNIGLVYQEQGLLEQADTHLRDAINRFPDYAGSYLTLGLILISQHNVNEAINIYNKGLERIRTELSLWSAKGLALKTGGKLDEAITHYQRALEWHPKVSWLHHNLAILLQNKGNYSEAILSLKKELSLDPKSETAQHLLAALQHTQTQRAPASYVRETFDGCAEVFEDLLVGKLQYRTPTLLANLLYDALGSSSVQFYGLDLGCGTGLFGEAIKTTTRELTGIDLSPKMIEKARARGNYARLIVGDLLDYMNEVKPDEFNLVAATDVFNYVGNLQPVFKEVARILSKGGWFIFSLEVAEDDSSSFILDNTGRFQHGIGYVPHLCEQHGFEQVSFTRATLRIEKGQPVEGYLYLLSMPG